MEQNELNSSKNNLLNKSCSQTHSLLPPSPSTLGFTMEDWSHRHLPLHLANILCDLEELMRHSYYIKKYKYFKKNCLYNCLNFELTKLLFSWTLLFEMNKELIIQTWVYGRHFLNKGDLCTCHFKLRAVTSQGHNTHAFRWKKTWLISNILGVLGRLMVLLTKCDLDDTKNLKTLNQWIKYPMYDNTKFSWTKDSLKDRPTKTKDFHMVSGQIPSCNHPLKLPTVKFWCNIKE